MTSCLSYAKTLWNHIENTTFAQKTDKNKNEVEQLKQKLVFKCGARSRAPRSVKCKANSSLYRGPEALPHPAGAAAGVVFGPEAEGTLFCSANAS